MTLENNYDIKSLTTPAATGGTVTTTATHRIHTFTSSGIFIANKAMNIEVLVVAGGGGGGSLSGGGGGAGGLIYNSSFAISSTSYNVVVGNGGSGGISSYNGNNGGINVLALNGGNSSFSSITATGGGAGGHFAAPSPSSHPAGYNGGSGGGAWSANTVGTGIVGQGKNGGTGVQNIGFYDESAGGGGGAGAVGSNGATNSGAGGIGLAYSISGMSTYYAGGGGAASPRGRAGAAGGNGGGGAGGSGTAGVAGTPNTGGGGGSGSYTGTPGTIYPGGNGGSGIVIISYPLSQDILSPANITAISMTVSPPSESPCRAEICTVGVSVTWKNTGESTGSSDLSITVSNGTSIITPSAYSSVSFAANEEVTREFTVSNMTAGTCSICPSPN